MPATFTFATASNWWFKWS